MELAHPNPDRFPHDASVGRPRERYLVPCRDPLARALAGQIQVPASKSMTQRYFNLALLSRTPTCIQRPLLAEDTAHYLEALAALGMVVERRPTEVVLTPGKWAAQADLFCGAGGTMLRFLTATLTALPGRFRLDGVLRLRERPLQPLLSALRQLGAEIHCLDRPGLAPLEIVGGSLRGGRAVLDAGVSSQFLSALLMAALGAKEPVEIAVAALTSAPYIALTLAAIARFGGQVQEPSAGVFRVVPAPLAGGVICVEGDDSAAAYPAAAVALCGGRVRLLGLARDSQQGDRGLLRLLEQMGASYRFEGDVLEVVGGRLDAITADLSAMPDQVPTLAALAPFARGTTEIRNVPHLRHKESDRLAAMAQELRRVGAQVEELPDGLTIPGVWAEREPPEQPVEVLTHGDHRIAMSMALVGLRRKQLTIMDPQVVAKSYPDFWHDLATLGGTPDPHA